MAGSKFKVGDRVRPTASGAAFRLIHDSSRGPAWVAGMEEPLAKLATLTVAEVDPKFGWFTIEGATYDGDNPWWYADAAFELDTPSIRDKFVKSWTEAQAPTIDRIALGLALPTDSKERKDIPIVRGCFDYFPAALAEVAKLSKAGNDKHNPGEEMHHARGKSSDHADCIVRHLMDRGTVDPEDGHRHSTKVAWRALALLQEELEREAGAPLARGARLPEAA